jgi:4-amino-4-deoxy-L-arabinose transferase-like glycosyltransferase
LWEVDCVAIGAARSETTSGAWQGVALCTVVAATYRLLLLATRFDVPGDGPSRTANALAWAASPGVPVCGGWPPGNTFLSGLFSLLVPAPLWSARILNVLLGTLTVPVLYGVAARTWDRRSGLAAAAALAVFPLHAELAATSLTETSFVFALVLGWGLLLRAAQDERPSPRASALIAAGAAISLAQMLR